MEQRRRRSLAHGARRLRHRVEQLREQRQRQPRSRAAVARRPHRHAAHVAQRRDRDVAVQDLKQEEPDRHARRELAITPAMTRLLGQLLHVHRQMRTNLKLDASDRRMKITSHPWPPVLGVISNTIFAGGRVLRKCGKYSYGAKLTLKRMALVTSTFSEHTFSEHTLPSGRG